MATTLYGPDGRPLRKRKLTREMGAPKSYGLRSIWWGQQIASGLTPRRLLRILRGADELEPWEFLTLAEEMEERDGHYASVLSTRKRAVSGLTPTVEAASDSKHDIELADAVRELVRKPNFVELLKDLLDALGKGYSVVEVIWQRGDHWTPLAYEWRDPRWFRLDRDDGRTLRLLDEAEPVSGVDLEPAKWICHVPKIKSGLPIRGGLARVASIAWMCKAYAVTDWVRYSELHGQPWRVGKYDKSAEEEDIDRLAAALANLGTDAAAVIPMDMAIEFITAKGDSGPPVYQGLAEFLDRQVSKAVLGQTMTTDSGSSRSQAEVHDRVRQDIREDDAGTLEATINRDLVRHYIGLNWGPQEAYPRVRLPVPDLERRMLLLKALEALVPLGLRVEASVVRDRFDLPDPPDGAEVLLPPAAVPAVARQRAWDALTPVARQRAGEAGLLDQLQEAALDGWQPVMDPLLEPLHALAASATTFEEFLAGLAGLPGRMDPAALVRALAAATFQARGVGDGRDAP